MEGTGLCFLEVHVFATGIQVEPKELGRLATSFCSHVFIELLWISFVSSCLRGEIVDVEFNFVCYSDHDPMSASLPSPPGAPSAPKLKMSISPFIPGFRYW